MDFTLSWRGLNGTGRRTFDGWLETVKSVEFKVAVRVQQLADGEPFRPKNPDSAKTDNIFVSLVAGRSDITF